MSKTTIRLLPCSYSDSDAMTEWLDAMSLHGYTVLKIKNIYAKFKKEKNRYYHLSVNSVTEQYDFSKMVLVLKVISFKFKRIEALNM